MFVLLSSGNICALMSLLIIITRGVWFSTHLYELSKSILFIKYKLYPFSRIWNSYIRLCSYNTIICKIF